MVTIDINRHSFIDENLEGRALSTQTHVQRAQALISLINKKAEEIKNERLDILLVGIGLDASPLQCTYLPFQVCAYLEYFRIPYSMTIVDIDKGAIKDLISRQTLYIDKDTYNSLPSGGHGNVWDQYLIQTGQSLVTCSRKTEDLKMHEYHEERINDYLVEQRIYQASIPYSFHEKITIGDIQIIHADITKLLVSTLGHFSLIDIRNVLYQLSITDQQNVLEELLLSLKLDGQLLTNDLYDVGTPLTEENTGWLSSDWLLTRHIILTKQNLTYEGFDLLLLNS